MKKIVLFLILSIAFSCNKKFNPNEYILLKEKVCKIKIKYPKIKTEFINLQ